MAFLAPIGAGLLGLTGTAATGFGASLAGGLAVATAGVGIAASTKSLLSRGSQQQRTPAPEPKPIPKAPTVEDATKKAESQVARRRRISLLSGGQTNITRGQATLSESDVGKKSLLGS